MTPAMPLLRLRNRLQTFAVWANSVSVFVPSFLIGHCAYKHLQEFLFGQLLGGTRLGYLTLLLLIQFIQKNKQRTNGGKHPDLTSVS